MSIFSNIKKYDKYQDKTKVLKSIRVDKATAVKIDELQAVCIAEKGTQVSQNQLLTGIVNSFVEDIENTAKDNETKALSKILAVIE